MCFFIENIWNNRGLVIEIELRAFPYLNPALNMFLYIYEWLKYKY